MQPRQNPSEAELEGNLRRFIAFRILFNARFYYPVFAILFLDLGLSLGEFAMVNVVWAVTIVLLEVPSGALADLFGRRRLVVLAAALMIAEMALLAFLPVGNHLVVLSAIILNRILSGAAEASASGADEAVAYDSLVALGRSHEWTGILERLMRWQSAAFVLSSILGATLYDAGALERLAGWCGWTASFDPRITLRIPILLTLLTGIAAFLTVLGIKEPPQHASGGGDSHPSIRDAWRQMLDAGKWILHTPVALVVIVAGFFYDSVIRLFLTTASQYYRLIQLPEASYGLLGSAFALLGFFTAPLGKRLAGRCGLGTNLAIVAALLLAGVAGLAAAIPWYGVAFVIPIGIGFFLNMFFLSHYLNEIVESRQRATVLSFKGLTMNLAYGTAGMLFAAQVTVLKSRPSIAAAPDPDMAAFAGALAWLPPAFLLGCALLWLIARWQRGPASAR